MTEDVERARSILEVAEPRYSKRWNVDISGRAIFYCTGDHEKHSACEWELSSAALDSPAAGE